MIEVKSVSIKLGKRAVVDDVSFNASGGEFVCLVGPNGAGKSTLLRGLAGVLPFQSGEIRFGDQNIAGMKHSERAMRVSWLPQTRPLAWNMLVEDVVALGRMVQSNAPYERLGPEARVAIDNAMRLTGAETLKQRRVGELSGGERARVHLARALSSSAESLLLDEPCAALDIAHQLSLMAILAQQAKRGRLVIAAMHDLSLAERFATRVIVLHEGGIYADARPAEALSENCLEEVFAVQRGQAGRLYPRS